MDDNISMFRTHIDIIKGSGVTLLKYNAMSLQLNWANSIMLWDLSTSLQIIFFYKPVVCQARDKVLPGIQSVWSDKNISPHLFKKKNWENDMFQCYKIILGVKGTEKITGAWK